MPGDLIDQLRAVPEFAVRLVLGGAVRKAEGGVYVTFQGESLLCPFKIFDEAHRVAKALSIDNSPVNTVNDLLKLRHKAEDLFIEILTLGGEQKLPKVLFVPAGQMASAYYRAMIPADLMTQNGAAVAHFTGSIDLGKAAQYDVLWVQLACSKILQSIAQKVKAAGKKVVYDVDDRFDVIPVDNPAAQVYVEQKLRDVWTMIALADLVTVSTETLATYIRTRHPNVKVLPNMVAASVWPRSAPKPADYTRILWAGSATHKRDLEIVAPSLRAVLERHAGKVRFTCFGEQVPELLVPVAKYVDQLPFVDFSDYAEALSKVGAHIAIAPLEKNDFNASKSAVKYLEYSACGYPTLLSAVGEYADLPAEAPKIVVDDKNWEKVLEYAISSPDDMAAMGAAAKKWVLDNRCVIRSAAAPWSEVLREFIPVPANQ